MTDDKYRVYIDADLSDDGKISVGDCYIQGTSDSTIGISCFDIARKLDVDFFFVKDFFDKLHEKGLIDKKECDIEKDWLKGTDTDI